MIIRRLFITFVLLISVITVAVFMSYSNYADQVKETVESQALLTAKNIAQNGGAFFKDYENAAIEFYNDRQMRDALRRNNEIEEEDEEREEEFRRNKNYIQKALYNIYEKMGGKANAVLISEKHHYRMENTVGYVKGGQIRDSKALMESDIYKKTSEALGYPVWFSGPEQSLHFYWRDYDKYGITNAATLGVSVLSPFSSELLGVLFINIDLSDLDSTGLGVSGAELGNVYLVSQNRTVPILSPSLDKPAFYASASVYNEMTENGFGLSFRTVSERPVLIAYQSIDNTGLFVVYTLYEDVLLAPLTNLRNRIIQILIVALSVVVLALIWAGISILAPIKKLSDAMAAFGHGDFSKRFSSRGKDEISKMGSYFNEMADNINILIEDAYIRKINEQQLTISQQNSRMYALQAQINPHFLYNTLDIIRWEAMYLSDGPNKVTAMIESFAGLCRMNGKLPSATIPIRTEIDYVSLYVKVMNFRQGEKIIFNYNDSPLLDEYYIPPLILQPLAENAIKYAFADSKENCLIDFLIEHREDGKILIVITDNGKGMEPDRLEKIRESLKEPKDVEESIGLPNICLRMMLLYKGECGFDIDSAPGVGTKITLTFPAQNYSLELR